jgi:hypothetical protein
MLELWHRTFFDAPAVAASHTADATTLTIA